MLLSAVLLIEGYSLIARKETWVLQHITNIYESILIGHSANLKEKYDAMKSVLQYMKYNDHQWATCVDLKMVNVLLGELSSYTKYPCFFCYWDSRDKANHWTRKDWPVRHQLNVVEKNIVAEPLVPRNKIVFPPLHIKLELTKQFAKLVVVFNIFVKGSQLWVRKS